MVPRASQLFGPRTDTKVRDSLSKLQSSGCAFVVFETEEARDKAVAKSQESSTIIKLGDKPNVIQLKAMHCEPDTVLWENFGHSALGDKTRRLIQGFGCILLGLLMWTVVFYGPYAWSIAHFNYDNGQEPGLIYGIAFSMVVVVGNNIMYEICARVSDNVGFLFKDEKEACYMVLYTIACMFNVLLDFVTTFIMAWQIMSGLGFRTHDGHKLETVTTFAGKFETYAMQRSLAENTYAYAFPSTYLIPFLIEPFITIVVPLKLGMHIVRTHPEIVGRAAEGWLVSTPMEMGRYADILLNVVLGILIFYFPGGYTHSLFFAMAMSHVFIYYFDHCRVLRTIPSCTFASMDVDWWAQAMLAPCCGLILSTLVFKANCTGYGYCLGGSAIVTCCTAVFWLHTAFHLLVLVYVVPKFGHEHLVDSSDASTTYKECNQKNPRSWFSCNPVHCLRSQHIYGHTPSCIYCETGKEHLMEVNESVGCFYEGVAPDAEDFNMSFTTSMKSLGAGIHSSASAMQKTMSTRAKGVMEKIQGGSGSGSGSGAGSGEPK